MIINNPETKDEIIQRLQKKLQAIEISYHDLLDNFDNRVKVASNRLYKEKIAAIRKIVK